MLNKLIHGDALDILTTLEDNSVEIIVTDPPYNSTSLNIDKTGFDLSKYLPDMKRVLKHNGWFFTFGTIDMSYIISQAGWRRKFEYVWVKSNAPPQTKMVKRPFIKHDYIFAFIKPELKKMADLYFDGISLRTDGEAYHRSHKKSDSEYGITSGINQSGTKTINDGYREGTTILYYPSKRHWNDQNGHPTQKPTALMEYLIKGYCKKGGTVLDPFMGSGSTCVGAYNTGRKYIGVEIEKSYYDIASSRLII